MKIYTGTSWSEKNQKRCAELGIGMMSSPVDLVHPDKILKEVSVSGDNSAFRSYRDKTKFDIKRFNNWINSIEREIDFIPYPDVVCKWKESIELSKQFIGKIPFKSYFVVQDGMTFDLVHSLLSESDGCFIGGSTKVGKRKGWKWQSAPYWIKHCKEIGLPVHMGRCPATIIGMDSAEQIGIDSMDSSSLIRNQWLDRMETYATHKNEQSRFRD